VIFHTQRKCPQRIVDIGCHPHSVTASTGLTGGRSSTICMVVGLRTAARDSRPRSIGPHAGRLAHATGPYCLHLALPPGCCSLRLRYPMSVHVERSGNDRQSLRRSAFAVDLTGRQLNKEDGMSGRTSGNYEIANRELVADGSNLRVQVLTLAAGQCVPWHYHSEITDTFVCLEGPMVVETRAPWHDYADGGAALCSLAQDGTLCARRGSRALHVSHHPGGRCLRFCSGRRLNRLGSIERGCPGHRIAIIPALHCKLP
jgi:hypothetical protein